MNSSLRVACLGTSSETVVLARFKPAGVEWVAVVGEGESLASTLAVVPQASLLASGEDLLNVPNLSLVFVVEPREEYLEVARHLAGQGVSLGVVPRAEMGLEFIYQLNLIRDENPSGWTVFPLFPKLYHPHWEHLQKGIATGRWGPVLHLQWERMLPTQGSPGFSWKLGTDALIADLPFLQTLAGNLDRVTAVRSGVSEETTVLATVNLTGPTAIPVTWTAKPGASAGFRLTVVSTSGNLELTGNEEETLALMEVGSEAKVLTADWGTACWSDFLRAREGSPTLANWQQMQASFDILDGVGRSLTRRRTINLYYETVSERSTFKSQMTAVGCSLLLLTLVGLFAGLGVGLLAEEFGWPPFIMKIVRILVFAPLFVFLVMQCLVFITRPATEGKGQ